MGQDVRVKDYRGMTELTAEQSEQLKVAKEADQQQRRQHHAAAAYTFVDDQATGKLNSGHTIPLVGLGTWKPPSDTPDDRKSAPGQVGAAVKAAVRAGYRHIDCATIYGNEAEVGNALSEVFAEGVVKREDLFITTKLWNADHGDAEGACKRSLASLKLDYLDLYLIHWPVTGNTGPELKPPINETWGAMQELVSQGLVRSIGVSNFSIAKIQSLLSWSGLKVKPAALQIEVHPYWPNDKLVNYAKEQGIHVTAYSPLGSPDSATLLKRGQAESPAGPGGVEAPQLMKHPVVVHMARRHGKSPAQVLVRWSVQRDCSVLPKSTNEDRIKANLDVFSWSLTDDDMTSLARIAEVFPQRMVNGSFWYNPEGPYKVYEDLWDEPKPDYEALREQVLKRYSNMDKQQPTDKFNSGYTMPLLGLGTWKSEPGLVRAAVLAAVKCGYRHIDCAAIYGNEQEVGSALVELLSEGVVRRDQLFITSKLWNSNHAASAVRSALEKTLGDLGLDYLDLYLIHWPVTGNTGPELTPPITETWGAMQECVEAGLVRSIGVSNFSAAKIQSLLSWSGLKVKPAVLQIEAHPYWPNAKLIKFAKEQGIHVTAYSPLGSPDSATIMKRGADVKKLSEEPKLLHIAERNGKSFAQVLIRWAIQRGTSVLPKSSNAERIAANFDVLDWQLSDDDMNTLSNLEYNQRMLEGNNWLNPAGPYKTIKDLWDE